MESPEYKNPVGLEGAEPMWPEPESGGEAGGDGTKEAGGHSVLRARIGVWVFNTQEATGRCRSGAWGPALRFRCCRGENGVFRSGHRAQQPGGHNPGRVGSSLNCGVAGAHCKPRWQDQAGDLDVVVWEMARTK